MRRTRREDETHRILQRILLQHDRVKQLLRILSGGERLPEFINRHQPADPRQSVDVGTVWSGGEVSNQISVTGLPSID